MEKFTLPEKWAIKTDNPEFYEFFNQLPDVENGNSYPYVYDFEKYIHYPSYDADLDCYQLSNRHKGGYTEITFEQLTQSEVWKAWKSKKNIKDIIQIAHPQTLNPNIEATTADDVQNDAPQQLSYELLNELKFKPGSHNIEYYFNEKFLASDSKLFKRTHHLKILPNYFDDIINYRKTFELRKNDRGFKVGDYVELCDGSRKLKFKIPYIFEGGEYGLAKDYCILSISELEIISM